VPSDVPPGSPIGGVGERPHSGQAAPHSDDGEGEIDGENFDSMIKNFENEFKKMAGGG
jgi:hypothetical protein